jgi:hypothetical protein
MLMRIAEVAPIYSDAFLANWEEIWFYIGVNGVD